MEQSHMTGDGGGGGAVPDKEESLQRLVRAMRGHDDEEATSLARRVLSSQIAGNNQDDDDDDIHYYHDQLPSTWRRIARKSTKPNARAETERVYLQLTKRDSSSMPPKMLMVLTKLMGKKIKMPPEVLPQQQQQHAPAPATPQHGMHNNTNTTSNSHHNRNTPMPSPSRNQSSNHHHLHSNNNAFHPHNNPSNHQDANNNNNNNNAIPHSTQKTHSLRASRTNTPKSSRPVDVHQLREDRLELESEEALLLRECLYSLQGIDGERIRYYRKDKENIVYNNNNGSYDAMDNYDGIRVQSPALAQTLLYSGRIIQTRLGSGATDALRICGEAGWLYNQIQSYVHQVQHYESKGIVARAFAGTLTEELRDYHSLLTQYESKLSDLTLRQIMVELRMPTARLKILALLTDGLRELKGGHLLSALYKHTLHGDTRHVHLVQTILYAASHPWFDILYLWTTQGVLSDPHGEFFVKEAKNVDAKHLWDDKYSIAKDQIPFGILDAELVRPAFNVGKGINFIRQCLLDGKWTMQLSGDSDDEETTTAQTVINKDLGYRYKPRDQRNVALQKTLQRAAELVHSHILRTLKQENNMMEHLWALKQFLFLGQGDFFSALMEGLHSEFSGEPGVAGIYKHSLLGIVEGALRSTNGKYLPSYVLDRLQVELMLEPEDDAYFTSTYNQYRDDQRTVWDIFMLDYQLPDPLVAIVHPDAMDKYKSVFSLLFGLKKVEFMLNFTWRQNATIQHALHTNAQYTGINIATSRGYAQASLLLRKVSILRQSMNHLIVNLKSYLMFEVLEGGWRRLQADIDSAKTLDEVIAAHDRYINGIVRKSLLRVDADNNSNKTDQNVEGQQQQQQVLADQVQTLLVIANEFCTLQENLFHDALLSADIAAEKRIHADRRSLEGRWGFNFQQDISEEENFFGLADRNTLREVVRVSELYNQNALELLRVLSEKVNGNPDDYDMYNNADVTMITTSEDPNETTFGPRVAVDLVDQDLDPQRFLIAQLDHNNYYGAQEEEMPGR